MKLSRAESTQQQREADAKLLNYLLYFLFIISALYSQPNNGGSGLELPFNNLIWMGFSFFFMTSVLLISKRREMRYFKLWPYFIFFPLLVIILSGLHKIHDPTSWLFKLLYIWGGFLFLIGLFQFKLTGFQYENLLFVIVIAGLVQGIIAVFQVLAPMYLPFWLPTRLNLPIGIFQQVNVLASFLVTNIMIILYIITRPNYSKMALIKKCLIFLSFAISIYIVFLSGSRTGLLALIISCLVIFISRYKFFVRQKKTFFLLIIIASSCFYLGQVGIEKTIDKSERLAEVKYSSARIAMYTIGVELMLKQPLGHGIENFLRPWNEQASDFVSRHPETNMPDYILHPHNEILLWMIEGGILALIGFLILFIGLLKAIQYCGFQRGGAYFAILLPISLHVQVEHPFYLSSLHWFLWLFILFFVLKHRMRTINLSEQNFIISRSTRLIVIGFTAITVLFLVNVLIAQSQINSFITGKPGMKYSLKIAENNFYTNAKVEQLLMRTKLYSGLTEGNTAEVKRYFTWGKSFVKTKPELKMYEDLISASVYLNPEDKGCDMINEALTMYAHNKPLQKARDEKCN